MILGEQLGDFPVLINIWFWIEFIESRSVDLLSPYQLREFLQRIILGAEVKVVEKSIFIIANVNEGRVKSLDNFFNSAQVYIAYGKFGAFVLIMKLNKRFIF